jgi:hypothetical protein
LNYLLLYLELYNKKKINEKLFIELLELYNVYISDKNYKMHFKEYKKREK